MYFIGSRVYSNAIRLYLDGKTYIVGFVKRMCYNITKLDCSKYIFCVHVRSHLEYACIVWSYKRKDRISSKIGYVPLQTKQTEICSSSTFFVCNLLQKIPLYPYLHYFHWEALILLELFVVLQTMYDLIPLIVCVVYLI